MIWLSYAGDGLWILVMSLIAATSNAARRQIPKDARLPVGVSGPAAWKAPRDTAFAVMVAAPLLLGLAFLIMARDQSDLINATIMLGVRATVAAVCALFHLNWLKGVMKGLDL